MSEERIQKVLAEAGIASRRAVEAMIDEGRIQVNGEPATLGQKVGPGARIMVDGRAIRHSDAPLASRVLLYKKRTGELVTKDDPEGRRTVFRKLPVLDTGRWIAVGRLDINTSGLLLLTNDGELAKRLTHPSYEISREYAVRVLGEMTKEILEGLRKGVKLEDGMAHFDSIDRGENEDGEGANQWWRVKLKEGRNREVRRLFESQGLQVSRLIRVAYGPIKLGRGVQSGGWRELDADELKELRRAVGFDSSKPKPAPKTRRVKGKDDEEQLPSRKPTKRDLERLDKAAANAKKIKPDRDAKPSGWSGYKARKPQ